MKLRVTRKCHTARVDGKLTRYGVGDTFDGTQKLLDAFSDRLEPVEGKTAEPVRESLIKQAENLGIKIDKRWKPQRIEQEIEAALEK